MQLVMELQEDLKVANVICMNGRRHIASSMHEFSRELVVHSHSKKKQALLDMLPLLAELRRALDMQQELEALVESGNYFRAFALLPEYLQLLDGYLELSAVKEMSSGIEAWLERTLQKLDALLLGVCRTFREDSYVTAVDAYALVGDVAGFAEKIQSFFMQEVLSETHSLLKDIVLEDVGNEPKNNRLTYSDLCEQIPESKFRHCLLKTLDSLFSLMSSYYAIMSFKPKRQDFDYESSNTALKNVDTSQSTNDVQINVDPGGSSDFSGSVPSDITENHGSTAPNSSVSSIDASDISTSSSSFNSPFYHLRKEAASFVSQTLDRRRDSLWQLATSRTSVLLSSPAVCSTSTFQFLRNYEDLNVFILAGEAFCGSRATEFRNRLKSISENYVAAFHRQNIYALKMVLERENWMKLSAETMQLVSLAGLIGDGAPLIVLSSSNTLAVSANQSKKNSEFVDNEKKDGFSYWLRIGNPFSSKLSNGSKELSNTQSLVNGSLVSSLADTKIIFASHSDGLQVKGHYENHTNGGLILEDENEDLLADFIDEDSQLPSRISKSVNPKNKSACWNDDEASAQTGSSICLLRLMDKYARLMQKLEIVNVDFFKGISQLFGVFYHFIFEVFGQRDANQSARLKSSLSKIVQECDQGIRPQNQQFSSSPKSISTLLAHSDVMPTIPSGTVPGTAFGLKERCVAAETLSYVAQILHRSKAHLQSRLFQQNGALVEDFFGNLVDSVPDLIEHIHKTTARMLLHINGYTDRIANAKWEVKELGLEHNGYVDLLLGEFKHYKTRLVNGGIAKEVQDLLLEYGLENVAEVLTEGLSRVRRCSDEGRVLMSLDLQVLINGLQHFVSMNVKQKLQVVETFIKAFYLPETEYVHWARSHPEYSRSQIVGLVNLVAAMKGWKRRTRLEVLDRIESGM
ncbi:syndetin isoform X2 [Phalaenopsis equestris]|nr:syndetin isoform X2 [Phalaenopsis equestris]